VVDVDGAASSAPHQLGREDLHVAREHDEVDAFALDELGTCCSCARLAAALAPPASGRWWNARP